MCARIRKRTCGVRLAVVHLMWNNHVTMCNNEINMLNKVKSYYIRTEHRSILVESIRWNLSCLFNMSARSYYFSKNWNHIINMTGSECQNLVDQKFRIFDTSHIQTLVLNWMVHSPRVIRQDSFTIAFSQATPNTPSISNCKSFQKSSRIVKASLVWPNL